MQRVKAFTLTELLMVITIIGVLSALLLPAVTKVKDSAQSAACRNHLRQIGQALQMYVHENNNKFPYYLGPAGPSYGDAIGVEGRAKGLVYWSSKLYPYYPVNWTKPGYRCPGYRAATTGPLEHAADRLGSYTYNLRGSMVGDNTLVKQQERLGLGPVLYWTNAVAISEAQVVVPAEMLSVGESRFPNGEAARGGKDTMECGMLDIAGMFLERRHGKNYNQLFCDGHVLGMDPWVLFDPTNSAPMWNYDHQSHPELWLP